MYGIMSGLEPRRYADGDLVQKALDLGVTPFGMSDEEIMQAIMQKQQVDDMSGASADFGEATEGFKRQVKDNFFDYTDPLEYATLPLVSLRAAKLAGKAGKGIYNAVRGPADQFGGKISQNLRGIGAYIGVDELARRGIPEIGIPGYQNPFGEEAKQARQDAQDEAAEDLKFMTGKLEGEDFVDFELNAEGKKQKGISLIDPDEPMEFGMSSEDMSDTIANKKTSLDKMKGLASLMEALGTSPGDVPQMTRTGDQFFGSNTFKPPGVIRMADGGIAEFGIGGIVTNIGKGFIKGGRDFYKKVTKKEAKQKGADVDKKKPDTKKETGVTKDKKTKTQKTKEEIIRAVPPELGLLASPVIGAGRLTKEAIRKLGGEGGLGRGVARTALYGTPLAMGVSALLPDKPTTTTTTNIATGGGDMDVLDGESLKDIHYARSMARAQEAGRDRPTFMDYVASFPGSYTDKLGKDPEFAQQMMAGFVAMMTPSEGYVPRNAIADFGGAVLKEQARQEGEVPDQIKLMELISEKPELLEAYKGFQKATKGQTFEELQTAAKLIEGEIKEFLYKKAGSKKPVLKKGSQAIGQPEILNAFTLYEMFEKEGGDSAALAKVIAQVEGVI